MGSQPSCCCGWLTIDVRRCGAAGALVTDALLGAGTVARWRRDYPLRNTVPECDAAVERHPSDLRGRSFEKAPAHVQLV